MSNDTPTVLILGGTGRTGSLLASKLAQQGSRPAPRPAAEPTSGSTGTIRPATRRALAGVDRLYLVTPVLRDRYAEQVARFLDLAENAGVRHVTFLSTHNACEAPPGIDIAAVEARLAARQRSRIPCCVPRG